jgi:hypothetical protein
LPDAPTSTPARAVAANSVSSTPAPRPVTVLGGTQSTRPAARAASAGAGQGELHADDEAVAPPGPPVVQGAVRGRAAEGLDAAGHGHQQGQDPAHGERDPQPGGGVGLAPPEPDEAEEPQDQGGHPPVAPGRQPALLLVLGRRRALHATTLTVAALPINVTSATLAPRPPVPPDTG